jgi:hypothetical protein
MIRYSTFPICRTCKFYKQGTCKQYGFKNVENGRIVNELASTCRSDKDMCGREGKDYRYDPHHHFNALKNNIETIIPLTIIFGGFVTYNISKL